MFFLFAAVGALPFFVRAGRAQGDTAASTTKRDYPIEPVPFTQVHVNDEFWAPKIETNRKVSIPTAFDQCERTGRIENFVRAAEVLRGVSIKDKHYPPFPFDDTDPYKVIEGASYALRVNPDPKLKAYIDGLIDKIAAAQEPDGYLYTTRTIDPQHPHPWAGTQRWQNEEVLSHELYNLGHLYEAAVAHYQATGERKLLDVALKSADLLVKTFGPGKRSIYSGHQIVEMGLVKLYRVTGRQQYLDLAKFFLDSRGPGGRAYNQADLRVVDQTDAEGHAVRATYMYSGMADVAALTGDTAYLKAIDRIWQNVVDKKLYITGGIGALGEGEAFGADYQLPNMSAYNETCAAVGNDFWNQRLFLLHGDAKYVDVFERTLYNGLISGVSLDGETYFYPNPLESNGQHQRSPWFGVACCPGNITRFMPSVPGYVYAQRGRDLYVNLYMSNTADVTLASGQKLNVVQETRYPWDGDVKLTVNPDAAGQFTVHMRVPGWARNEVVPGDLYRFADGNSAVAVHLKVNGHEEPLKLEAGYAVIARTWKKGDVVELPLPMPVRRVVASQSVTADLGRVALQRGPIVYAAEWVDSPDKHVRNIVLSGDEKLTARFEPAVLNGVDLIKGQADGFSFDEKHNVKHTRESFTAIPYYAWANRGPGQMEVWIATSQATVHPTPYPTLATKSKVTSSGPTMAANGVRDPRLVADQEEPTSSADTSSFYDWLPKKGSSEWIQYEFPHTTTIHSSDVYWFQELNGRQIKLPKSWSLLYRDGNEWRPVAAQGNYAVNKDQYNHVEFKPVQTNSLRLVLELEPNASAGIQEWRVQ
ncbi:MAG: glycoside hydrolase family 127 protein [Bryobacteraceae bacterium]